MQSPLPCSVTLQAENRQFSVKCETPTTEEQLVQLQHVPYTYLHIMSNQPTPQIYQTQEREITNPKVVRPVQVTVSKY